MNCEKCNNKMMQVGSFVYRCVTCNDDDDNGGGVCLVQ